MLTETINILSCQLKPRLQQLIILIITQSYHCINSTGEEQINLTGETHPFVIHLFLPVQYKNDIVEVGIKDCHFLAPQLQRVVIPT